MPRVWAWFINLQGPLEYYTSQATNPIKEFPPQAHSLTLQVGNVFLLLAALAVICSFSPSRATAKWYLVSVAFADYGHILAVKQAVGPEVFWSPALWNESIASNVVVSLVLNVARWATVLGIFGKLKELQAGEGQKKRI